MLKELSFFFVFTVGLFVETKALGDQLQSIQTLMSSFGNSCTIQGSQSRRLNESSQNLANSIRGMLSSTECAGLQTIAAGVQSSLDRLVSSSPQYTYEEIEYRKLADRKSVLVASIAFEQDESILSGLRADLRSVEIQIAEMRQQNFLNSYNQKNARLYDAANSYRSAMDALLKGMASNEQCLLKNPSLSQDVATFGVALAQSSTLAASTTGASILAGAGLFTVARIAEYLKDKKNAELIKKISNPMLASSLSCVLENLNEIYCDSEKIERLGTFILSPKNRINTDENSPFAGLDLLDKAIPSIDNTLTLFKIGSDPSSAQDALKRLELNALKITHQSSRGILAGMLNDLRRQVGALSPNLEPPNRRSQIFRAQKEFIANFLNYVNVRDESPGNPLTGEASAFEYVYKGQKARYYLMGFDPAKIVPSTDGFVYFRDLEIEGSYTGSPNPWMDYALSNGSTHFHEDIGVFQAEIEARFELWYTEALSILDTKANLILKTDKKEILASLDEPLSRDYRMTPLVALQKLSQYLTSPGNQRYLKPKYQKIALEVSEVIENKIIAAINSVSFDLPEQEFEKAANAAFISVLRDTRYDDDSRFFINRLNVLVQAVISEAAIDLYKTGDPQMIYALASNDVVKELKSFNGRGRSTVDMVHDSNKTKGQVIDLFSAFVYGFNDPIRRSLVELNRPENLKRRAVERGHLCLQLLGLDENFDPKFRDYVFQSCKGATLPPILGSPSAPIFSRDLWKLPVEGRICSHQDWRRKLYLFEKGYEKRAP